MSQMITEKIVYQLQGTNKMGCYECIVQGSCKNYYRIITYQTRNTAIRRNTGICWICKKVIITQALVGEKKERVWKLFKAGEENNCNISNIKLKEKVNRWIRPICEEIPKTVTQNIESIITGRLEEDKNIKQEEIFRDNDEWIIPERMENGDFDNLLTIESELHYKEDLKNEANEAMMDMDQYRRKLMEKYEEMEIFPDQPSTSH